MSGLSIRRDISLRYGLLGVAAILCVATLLCYGLATGSQDAQAAPVEPDTTSPVVEHLSLDSTPTYRNSLTVHGTVTDEHLKNYNLRIYDHDKTPYVPWNGTKGTESVTEGELGTLDIGTLPDGEYYVRIWADDQAGNRTGIKEHIYIPFTVDRTATLAIDPVTTIDLASTISGSLLWNAGGEIAGADVSLAVMQDTTTVATLQATTDASGKWSVVPPQLTNGAYMLVATSGDRQAQLAVTFAQEQPPVVEEKPPAPVVEPLPYIQGPSDRIAEQPVLQSGQVVASFVRSLPARNAAAADVVESDVVADSEAIAALGAKEILSNVDAPEVQGVATERTLPVTDTVGWWWTIPLVAAMGACVWRVMAVLRR